MSLSRIVRDAAAHFPKSSSAIPLVFIVTAPLGAPQAHAQAGDEANRIILVTAQKREEQLSQIAVPASVIERADGLRAGVKQLADVAELTAGFYLATSLRGVPVYTLRGVGFNSPNLSASSPVGLYQDEIAYPFPAMSEGPVFDVERIEILKGPQGTLFGRSTTGGLVNTVTRKPGAEAQAEMAAHIGSFGGYGLDGTLGGPIGEGLGLRLAFSSEWTDEGWQKSVTRDAELGKVDRLGARLSLAAQPSDHISVLVTGNWWRDRSETQAPQAVQFYPQGLIAAGVTAPEDWRSFGTMLGLPDAVFDQTFTPDSAEQADWTAAQLPWGGSTFTPAPLEFRKDNTLHSVSLRTDSELDDTLTLTTLSAYTHYRRNEVREAAGWNLENAILQGLGSASSQSHEIRLAAEHGPLEWIAGASLSRDAVTDFDRSWVGTTTTLQVVRATAAQWAALAGANDNEQAEIFYGARDAQSRTQQVILSRAVFGQLDYALAPRLTLTVGARYTWDRMTFSGCSGDSGNGSLSTTLNAFYSGLGIPAAAGPGDCTTFLGEIAPALLSGGEIPFPGQGLHRDILHENSFSGRFALGWQASPAMLVYTSLSHGSKAGVFPNIEANIAGQYTPAKRERLTALEAGIKALPARWLRLDASAFYYLYRDKQTYGSVEDILFASLARIVNIPRSHVIGLDAAVTATPADRLNVALSASLLHSRIDEYVGFDDFGTKRDFSGGSFSHAPQFQLAASLTQEVDLTPGIVGDLGLTLRHSSGAQADLLGEPEFRIRPSTEVDLHMSVAFAGGSSQLSLLVKNLGNSYHWNNVLLQSDSFTRYAAMPRHWSLNWRQRF